MPKKPTTTREEMIEGAFQLIRREGFSALTVRRLAEELGCSTQPIMYQFPDLEVLKDAVYEKADRFHSEYILEDDDFLEIGLRYIRFASEEGNLFRFLFQTDKFGGLDVEALMKNPNLEAVITVMAKGLACEETEAREMFLTFFSVAHGLASLLANNSMKYDEGKCRKMLESVFFGMLASRKGKQHTKPV